MNPYRGALLAALVQCLADWLIPKFQILRVARNRVAKKAPFSNGGGCRYCFLANSNTRGAN